MTSFLSFVAMLLLARDAQAHIAPYNPGLYCLNGSTSTVNLNANDPVLPSFQMTKADWWMHAWNGCDKKPPPSGKFLTLPAGGSFSVEMAGNQAVTSFSYGGRYKSAWGDGQDHPDDYNSSQLNGSCIFSPNLHTLNQTDAAGSVFAISYTSNLSAVTPSNLAVFTVAPNTPWKLDATFQVPSALPACPPGGCICVWGWVPNHCGTPNMYMIPSRCQVTGAKGTKRPGTAKPPVWCENNPSACVKGPKQMVFYNQLDGNNINLTGYQADGQEKSPGYNSKLGFSPGAQNDIFV